MSPTILYLVTEDWYFCSHRLPVARAARDAGARIIVATRVADHGAAIEREGFALRPLLAPRPLRRCARPEAWRRSGASIAASAPTWCTMSR